MSTNKQLSLYPLLHARWPQLSHRGRRRRGREGQALCDGACSPHPGANILALISTPPFYGYKVTAGARGSKDGVCEVYTVIWACVYTHIYFIYIYLFYVYI